MSAIVIRIENKEVNYTIFDSYIVFQKSNIIIGSYIIPDNYNVLKINEMDNYNEIIIGKPKLRVPISPIDYQNVTISNSGLYQSESIYSINNKPKKILYVDTSYKSDIDLETMFPLSLLDDYEVPNNFWFSNDFFEQYMKLYTKNSNSWLSLDDVVEYASNFDVNSKLISKNQLLTILAEAVNDENQLKKDNIDIRNFPYKITDDIIVYLGHVRVDNWLLPFTSEKTVYALNPENRSVKKYDYSLTTAYFPWPVIEEQNKVKQYKKDI